MASHCATCTCDKRAPVQGDRDAHYSPASPYYNPKSHPQGSVTWEEHLEAYVKYATRYGNNQSPERLAKRGGFGYAEITELLGHEPTTWRVWVRK